jgi:hypothetical protein
MGKSLLRCHHSESANYIKSVNSHFYQIFIVMQDNWLFAKNVWIELIGEIKNRNCNLLPLMGAAFARQIPGRAARMTAAS